MAQSLIQTPRGYAQPSALAVPRSVVGLGLQERPHDGFSLGVAVGLFCQESFEAQTRPTLRCHAQVPVQRGFRLRQFAQRKELCGRHKMRAGSVVIALFVGRRTALVRGIHPAIFTQMGRA